MSIKVLPSLPAADFRELEKLSHELVGLIDEFQVDIVDGLFVPLRAWPFNDGQSHQELLRLQELPESIALELDCMVLNPEQYFDLFVVAGVKKVVIHYGSTDNILDTIALARSKGFSVGLGFTNDVPLEAVSALVAQVDYLQVMGIVSVGQQGQTFDERTITTIEKLRAENPEITIAVDGSVNENTIASLVAAGANRFAPGSAIAKAIDTAEAYKHLVGLATAT